VNGNYTSEKDVEPVVEKTKKGKTRQKPKEKIHVLTNQSYRRKIIFAKVFKKSGHRQ
jgi:hypothetical protein